MAFKIPQDTPGPSPWYLKDGTEVLPGFRWHAAGDGTSTSGKTALSGPRGTVAILNFYNYVVPLPTGRLLVWHQKHIASGPTKPVVLRVLEPASLRPLLGTLEVLCSAMKEQDVPLLLDGAPEAEVELETTESQRAGIRFPDSLRHLDELLIPCHSSFAEPAASWERGDIALMVASPAKGSLSIHPQDWFNRGNTDFGYEWITRFARDPATGRVHGEGIRIAPFILEPNLRTRAANAA